MFQRCYSKYFWTSRTVETHAYIRKEDACTNNKLCLTDAFYCNLAVPPSLGRPPRNLTSNSYRLSFWISAAWSTTVWISCSQSKYFPLSACLPFPDARYTHVCPGTSRDTQKVFWKSSKPSAMLGNSSATTLSSGSTHQQRKEPEGL